MKLQQVDKSCTNSVPCQNKAAGATGQRRMTLLQKAPLSQFYRKTEEMETVGDSKEGPSSSDRPRPRRSSFVPTGGHLEEGQVFRPPSQSSMAPSIKYYVSQQRRQPDGFLSNSKSTTRSLSMQYVEEDNSLVYGTSSSPFGKNRSFDAVEGSQVDPCVGYRGVSISQAMPHDVGVECGSHDHVEQEETSGTTRKNIKEKETLGVAEERDEEVEGGEEVEQEAELESIQENVTTPEEAREDDENICKYQMKNERQDRDKPAETNREIVVGKEREKKGEEEEKEEEEIKEEKEENQDEKVEEKEQEGQGGLGRTEIGNQEEINAAEYKV
ncbi:hypothetical protein AAHC03_016793 [Spirometra sp. Aus1]